MLGPGQRAVIWVQGCPFACPNCIVPESWDATGGKEVPLEELKDWILAQPDIEGVTLSGGEPMAQAQALTRLVKEVRRHRDLGVVCYTGYTHEHLMANGTEAQRQLLRQIDLLIDGVYLARRHADLLWRGSSNQRLLFLTERYRKRMGELAPGADRSAGVEFFQDERGAVAFAGVPAQPGFREEFAARMAQWGIGFEEDEVKR